MDDMNSKPDGFYDAIDFPYKRKADLFEYFKEYTIQEHTNSEKGYANYVAKNASSCILLLARGSNLSGLAM